MYDVYAGDTITVIFYLFNEYYKFKIRLADIDTPGIRTKDLIEKEKKVCSFVIFFVLILNKICKIKCKKNDKYGRILAVIYLDDKNINELLITKKYANYYKKK